MTTSLEHYKALFNQTKTQPSWLNALRQKGFDHFLSLGFPHPKQEIWKYTDLSRFKSIPFATPSSTPEALSPLPKNGFDFGSQITFLNGRLTSLPRLPDGVRAVSMNQTLQSEETQTALQRMNSFSEHPLVALNTAFLDECLMIRVSRGTELQVPLVLQFVATSQPTCAMWHPRVLIVLEEGSSAAVLEHYTSLDQSENYFANHMTEVSLSPESRLYHYKLQRQHRHALHYDHTVTHQAERSYYETFALSFGSLVSRHELYTHLNGPRAACHVNGAYLIRDRQHCDTTSSITHAYPECTSRQVYRGVIDDHAQGVFQGKIIVRPQAQKTDGYQLNQTLLLSEKGDSKSKPELEIFADDVKCSHGATSGALDESSLFYLQSRGLDRERARNLLIMAFIESTLEEVSREDVREAYAKAVDGWLTESAVA